MIKYFCDKCGKEVDNKELLVFEVNRKVMDTFSDEVKGKKPAMPNKEICVWCFQKVKDVL